MILEHDGHIVDYFETFPIGIKHIGLYLSGGMDSALTLYCLAAMIESKQQQHRMEIYPIHGYDIRRTIAKSYQVVENIIEYVRQHFPSVTIHDPHIVAFRKTEADIVTLNYLQTAKEYLTRRYHIQVFIDGLTKGMPNSTRPNSGTDDPSDEDMDVLQKRYPLKFPFGGVRKDFVAAQYKKLDILPLSLKTVSCIDDATTPCKTCWWCKERYWAIKNYDGGVD